MVGGVGGVMLGLNDTIRNFKSVYVLHSIPSIIIFFKREKIVGFPAGGPFKEPLLFCPFGEL